MEAMQNHPVVTFWVIFGILSFLIIYCDSKYKMLKDISVAVSPPYSWARVQLAWWTVIVLSSFIAIMGKHGLAPTLHESTVILIGISAATIATARAIDVNELTNTNMIVRHQDKKTANFFIDIISDQNGPGIHRFQTVVFNAAFGLYFISYVLNKIHEAPEGLNLIMPVISNNNLVLLGLSSATYAALKLTENKSGNSQQGAAREENITEGVDDTPAVG